MEPYLVVETRMSILVGCMNSPIARKSPTAEVLLDCQSWCLDQGRGVWGPKLVAIEMVSTCSRIKTVNETSFCSMKQDQTSSILSLEFFSPNI